MFLTFLNRDCILFYYFIIIIIIIIAVVCHHGIRRAISQTQRVSLYGTKAAP